MIIGPADHSRRVLTDRGRTMVAAGTTLLVAGAALGFSDLVRVGVLVAALPVLSLVLARRGMPELTTTRLPDPPTVTLGRPNTVRLEVHNPADSGQRTPVLLGEEILADSFGGLTRFVLPPIASGASTSVSYVVTPRRRGRHRAGPLVLQRRDPFGLSAQVTTVPGDLDVLVLPRIHPLGGLASGSGSGMEGSTPSMVALHGGDDASIRGYRQGDDLRRIHWPVTAHRGSLMVRHEGRPSSRRAVLVLDTLLDDTPRSRRVDSTDRAHLGDPTGSMDDEVSPWDGATENPSEAALEWAVEALASVAAYLGGEGYALHVVVPSTQPEHDVDRALPVADAIAALAVAQPLGESSAAAPVRANFLAAARDLSMRGGLVVATVGTADPQAVHDLLSVRAAGAVGLVFLIDTDGGHRDDGRGDRAGALAALARTGGWHAVVVDPSVTAPSAYAASSRDVGGAVDSGDAVRRAWQALIASASPRGGLE